MKLLLLGLPFLAAAALSLGLTPLAKRLAARLGAMDHPNERQVHKAPVPRPVPPAFVEGLFLGLLPVFAVSFLDDVKPLSALLGAAVVGLSRLGYDELAVIRKGTVLRIYDLPALKTGFFVVFTGLLLILVNSSRSSYRLLEWLRSRSAAPGVPVLLVGAGRRGSMAVRELTGQANAPFRPVGFVDNDPDKQGRLLNGVPVVGTTVRLEELIEQHGAKGVVVTSPRIPDDVVAAVEEACASAGVSFLTFNVSFEGTVPKAAGVTGPPSMVDSDELSLAEPVPPARKAS